MSHNSQKTVLFVTVMPYELKIATSFYPEENIGDIQFFIEQTMNKFRSRLKIGRIEKKSNSAWLLPQYKIKDFLEDYDELIAYIPAYGLTLRKLPENSIVEDIDAGFIGKKTRRGFDDKKAGKDKLASKKPDSISKKEEEEQYSKLDSDDESEKDSNEEKEYSNNSENESEKEKNEKNGTEEEIPIASHKKGKN